MSTYKITVNGVAYDVEVENTTPAAAPEHQDAPAPAASEFYRPAAPAAAGGQGSIRVEASVAGKIWKIVASVGQAVKSGDSIVILEAMKMEIPVVAPQDGTIASIDLKEGDPVEVGYLIATMN